MRILILSCSDITAEPFVNGLRALRRHVTDVLFYDKHRENYGLGIFSAFNKFNPDIVIYFGYPPCPHNIDPMVFKDLNSKVPVIFIAGDLSERTWWPLLKTYYDLDCFRIYINIDGRRDWPCERDSATILSPWHSDLYNNPIPLKDRRTNLGFAGGLGSPSRQRIIFNLIEKSGLVMHIRNESFGSYDNYVKFMMNCRIVVNVPISGSDSGTQVKGRVIETGLSCGCLLEHESAVTREWFNPGIDYITYKDPEHAVKVVKELSSDIDYMQAIANNLHKKVKSEHDYGKVWENIFSRII